MCQLVIVVLVAVVVVGIPSYPFFRGMSIVLRRTPFSVVLDFLSSLEDSDVIGS